MSHTLRLVWENPAMDCAALAPADAWLRGALRDLYRGAMEEDLPAGMAALARACERRRAAGGSMRTEMHADHPPVKLVAQQSG